MKTIIAVLSLLLAQSGVAQKPNFEQTFEAQLKTSNAAMIIYAATDCTTDVFNDRQKEFVNEIFKLADLVNTMPEDLDPEVKIRLLEESYGFEHLERQFIAAQNACVDAHNRKSNLSTGGE